MTSGAEQLPFAYCDDFEARLVGSDTNSIQHHCVLTMTNTD